MTKRCFFKGVHGWHSHEEDLRPSVPIKGFPELAHRIRPTFYCAACRLGGFKRGHWEMVRPRANTHLGQRGDEGRSALPLTP
jgi:hypothetical protein